VNKLTSEERAKILHLLCEGNSIRAVTRLTGVSKNTVTKLLVDAGRALSAFQDKELRNLQCKRIQLDEIWSFVYSMAVNFKDAKAVPLLDAGEVWTWTAICADTKLACTWYIGDRSAHSATQFSMDLKSRLTHSVQITSVAHHAYPEAINADFGDDIDYAVLEKIYGTVPEGTGRYSPPVCMGAIKEEKEGSPDPARISPSFVERSDLTMRMNIRGFTRLTNAFSKKVENHACAVALHFAHYNFVRIHETRRVTPAMAAGITDRLLEVSDLVAIVEAAEPEPAKRGPYKIERHG
jgi:helix-turn-helix protein